MRRIINQVLLCSLFVLCLSACPQETGIRIEPGSTVQHLEFRVSSNRDGTQPASVGVFRIDPCETTGQGRALWLLVGTHGSAPLHRLTYGQTPYGFSVSASSRALVPGCYRASTSGTGKVIFDVRADGSVQARP